MKKSNLKDNYCKTTTTSGINIYQSSKNSSTAIFKQKSIVNNFTINWKLIELLERHIQRTIQKRDLALLSALNKESEYYTKKFKRISAIYQGPPSQIKINKINKIIISRRKKAERETYEFFLNFLALKKEEVVMSRGSLKERMKKLQIQSVGS